MPDISFFTAHGLAADLWSKGKPFAEILILWIAFYHILAFFEGTRAFQVLRGIIYLLVAFLLSQILQLHTVNLLLTKFFGISILGLIIIFQQELRQGLARLGQQHLFNVTLAESDVVALIEEIASAVFKLASKKIGCIIAIEQEIKLKTYIESGILLDSKASAELLQSIFTPPSPLHDGGVIIRGERIVAASCLFPLTENPHYSKMIGTRRRAALGMSEQTDSVIIIVSEETGEVLFAVNGYFTHIENREHFVATLKDLFLKKDKTKK